MGKTTVNPVPTTNTYINRRKFVTALGSMFLGGSALAAIGAGTKFITDSDRREIDTLKNYTKGIDLRAQEKAWAERVWPTVQYRLVRLYEAEDLDNKELKKGIITQKDRRVKISYTQFVPPGQRGNDRDKGPSFHVVKRFDDKQEDGTVLRTYVNESWPLAFTRTQEKTYENGEKAERTRLKIGILPAETIRIRVQTFKGDLQVTGAENLFVTDLIQAVWAIDPGGLIGENGIYPSFVRQHLYAEQVEGNDGNKFNPKHQVYVPVSSPLRCATCHSSNAIFTQDIFLKPGEKKKNFGAITPDEEFSDQKAPENQLGYKQLEHFLNAKLNDETEILDKSLVDAILNDLKDTTSVELPYMADAVKQADNIHWVDSDEKPIWGRSVDLGLTYTDTVFEDGKLKEKEFYRAIAAYHGDSIGLGTWWKRNELILIPRNR